MNVGARVSVGHRAVVHGCTVEDDSLVGMGAVVLNGAVVGRGSLVAAGSVVTPGTQIPGGMVAAGVPCKPTKPIGGTSSEFWVETNAVYYRELAGRHAAGTSVIDPGPDERA